MAEILLFPFRKKQIKYYNYDFPPFPSKYYMESELDIIERYMDVGINDIFLDIGCTVGSWTLPALSLGANVIGFEPVAIYHDILYDNITLNDWSRSFRLVPRAVWNEDNKHIPFNFGRYEHTIFAESFFVNSIRLDSFSFDRIDFIKIDVEGAELMVLDGAAMTLKRYHPKVIIEHHENIAGPIEGIFKSFSSGYSGSFIGDGKWLFK